MIVNEIFANFLSNSIKPTPKERSLFQLCGGSLKNT